MKYLPKFHGFANYFLGGHHKILIFQLTYTLCTYPTDGIVIRWISDGLAGLVTS
ncbi:MAG: hypothetical protein R3C26_00930 [Calditrichia bacterium]